MQKVAAAVVSVALTMTLAVFTGAALAGGGQGGDHRDGKSDSSRQVESHHSDSARGQEHSSKSSSHESRPDSQKSDSHERGAESKPETRSYSHERKQEQVSKHETKSASESRSEKTHYGPHEKVYICHSTGSATNPYVLIHVSKNALKAHTSHHDGHDVVLGDSAGNGCPAPQAAKVETKTEEKHVLAETEQKHETAKVEEKHEQRSEEQKTEETHEVAGAQECMRTVAVSVPVGVKHFIGPKGSGRYVIIRPSPNSAHYANKHPDEILYESRTVTVRADCSESEEQVKEEAAKQAVAAVTTTTTTPAQVAGTVTVTATTTVPQTVTQTVTAETAGAVAGRSTTTTPVEQSGGVLGAQATLPKSPKGGGVLGTAADIGRTVGSTTLPFTGLPLWAVVIAALGVGGLGLAVRRGLRDTA